MKKNFLKLLLFVFLLISFSCNKHLYLTRQQPSQSKINGELLEDTSILNFYRPYKQSLDSQMNEVVGSSLNELVKSQPESNLSNFFADAVAESCRAKAISFDFAFPTTNGGIRASMPKGNWTLRNIFELMPFENELVVLQIEGRKVQELANQIIAKGGQPVSGFRIVIKNKSISEIRINNEMLDSTRSYKILTSDYLANGGDGIVAFTNPISSTALNYKTRNAILDYVKSQTKLGISINAQTDGRIKFE